MTTTKNNINSIITITKTATLLLSSITTFTTVVVDGFLLPLSSSPRCQKRSFILPPREPRQRLRSNTNQQQQQQYERHPSSFFSPHVLALSKNHDNDNEKVKNDELIIPEWIKWVKSLQSLQFKFPNEKQQQHNVSDASSGLLSIDNTNWPQLQSSLDYAGKNLFNLINIKDLVDIEPLLFALSKSSSDRDPLSSLSSSSSSPFNLINIEDLVDIEALLYALSKSSSSSDLSSTFDFNYTNGNNNTTTAAEKMIPSLVINNATSTNNVTNLITNSTTSNNNGTASTSTTAATFPLVIPNWDTLLSSLENRIYEILESQQQQQQDDKKEIETTTNTTTSTIVTTSDILNSISSNITSDNNSTITTTTNNNTSRGITTPTAKQFENLLQETIINLEFLLQEATSTLTPLISFDNNNKNTNGTATTTTTSSPTATNLTVMLSPVIMELAEYTKKVYDFANQVLLSNNDDNDAGWASLFDSPRRSSDERTTAVPTRTAFIHDLTTIDNKDNFDDNRLSEQQLSQMAQMGTLAGAIYIPSDWNKIVINDLNMALVRSGTVSDVNYLVTDGIMMIPGNDNGSVAAADDGGRRSTLVRIITIRGFDASDDNVDRERLVRRIVGAAPELYDWNYKKSDNNGKKNDNNNNNGKKNSNNNNGGDGRKETSSNNVDKNDDDDVNNDATNAATTTTTATKKTTIRVHAELMRIAEDLYDELQPWIDGIGKDHKLILNGHSVGGSLAVLLMMVMRKERGAEFVKSKIHQIYTFGSPPVTSVTTPSSSSSSSSIICPLLSTLNLPPTFIISILQPWDPIIRLFTTIDPLYPLIDDLGPDGVTLYASGPPLRSLRPILRTILENWNGWPTLRTQLQASFKQDYVPVGTCLFLLPDVGWFITDRFVLLQQLAINSNVNVAVPEVSAIAEVRGGGMVVLELLEELFPLDELRISLVPVALRSFVHHFFPAYSVPLVEFVEKRDKEMEKRRRLRERNKKVMTISGGMGTGQQVQQGKKNGVMKK